MFRTAMTKLAWVRVKARVHPVAEVRDQHLEL